MKILSGQLKFDVVPSWVHVGSITAHSH